MPTINEVIRALEQLYSLKDTTTNKINELNPENFFDPEDYRSVLKQLRDEETAYRDQMKGIISKYDQFPERHSSLFDRLDDFYRTANTPNGIDASFDNSVFVMTKFPEPSDSEAPALQAVIDCVTEAIKARGYVPRIATERDFHEWLWGNVTVFLLGCRQGVAIVEDKYRPEFNPNVAMEWGWMRGMGRRVLFLREEGFKNDRADWSGVINHAFNWASPKAGIEVAINRFLEGSGP